MSARAGAPGVRDTARVVRVALRGLYRSRLPQMAAALAFRTLFALIPVLVISVAVVGAFAEREDVKSTLSSALDGLGVSEIVIRDEEAEPRDTTGERAGSGDAPSQPDSAEPPSGPEPAQEIRLQELLTGLVDRLLEIPFRAIGAVGLITLIYAAISMLTEIERAFNHVYRATAGRSWPRRITQYWSILTLGALLLFATFYISEQFRGFGASAVGYAVGVAITALLLVLAYTTVPNTRVHVRTAAVGGLVAAVLWEAAKWSFRQYVDYSVSYARLYGSLGVLPLFMLWIYFTWLIVLFGLQISFGLQHVSAARELAERDRDHERLTDPASILPLLATIGRDFARGRATKADRLADDLDLPAAAADAMLDALVGAGLVHPIDGDDGRFSLAKPADTIPVPEVLRLAHRMSSVNGNGLDALRRGVERIRAAQIESAAGMTLADLIAGAPAESGTPDRGQAPYHPA